jgi:peptidoglycan/xylan/chitin deacetylase (PgdA/CDA1 family)
MKTHARKALFPGLAWALLPLLFAAGAPPLVSETSFSDLNIAPDNRLLFTATSDLPESRKFSALFQAGVDTGIIEQLSFYPEDIQFVDNNRILQIQNRFGVFRSDEDLKSFSPVKGFPCFSNGSPARNGKLVFSHASPDGRFLLSVRAVNSVVGELVLQDTVSGEESVVSKRVARSTSRFPAQWSPDSLYFVYASEGKLYYFSINQLREKRVPEERLRSLCPGEINSAYWNSDRYLYVISGDRLYRVDPQEFFTRTLYSEVLGFGNIVAAIPFSFDPGFDRFYLSPTGQNILIVKGGRSVFIHEVKPDDGNQGLPSLNPYLYLPVSSRLENVLWPADKSITVFVSEIANSEKRIKAYVLSNPELPGNSDPDTLKQSAQVYNLDKVRDISLSPNGQNLAIVGPASVKIFAYGTFAPVKTFASVSPRRALWKNDSELVIAGDGIIEGVSLKADARSLITLSQADRASWLKDSGDSQLIAMADGQRYLYGKDRTWRLAGEVSAASVMPVSTYNENYRVFTDELYSGAYRNSVVTRSITGLKTSALFPPPANMYDPFPLKDEDNALVFSHGSRIRRREVSIVIDAQNGSEGLCEVLNTLKEYGITTDFFVNGEFIRRNPGATKSIAQSGHEVGSLFFADFNLTDARYAVDEEFIRRGLARNEDDYFGLTGKELSAIWHAPYYAMSTKLSEAAKTLNYTYIGRDVDPLDWIGVKDQYQYPGMYLSVSEIIERVMAKKRPGSIIPIRLGMPSGGRSDYLFQDLDILINALIEQGYSIVPISTLMEHAK